MEIIKEKVLKSDLWKEIILRLLTRIGVSLTINGIAIRTRMSPVTAKKKLLELEIEGKVKRAGKKWIINK